MGKIFIMIAGVGIVFSFGASAALGAELDFDGRGGASFTFQTPVRLVSLLEKDSAIETPLVSKPVALEAMAAEIDYSILQTMRYSEQRKVDPLVVSNLEKLLILGTRDEKKAFINSSKYTFPQRFAQFGDGKFPERSGFIRSKGLETHCWEDNCRMVEVCGDKKSCERSCQLVGVTCAAAGTAITQYYTGGAFPSASTVVGGAAGLGCKWACDDWVCGNIQDCHEVQKCDSHCETISVTDGVDHVDQNTGQTQYN